MSNEKPIKLDMSFKEALEMIAQGGNKTIKAESKAVKQMPKKERLNPLKNSGINFPALGFLGCSIQPLFHEFELFSLTFLAFLELRIRSPQNSRC
jgi:hypothetical protein